MTFASVDGIKMLLYMTRRTTQNFINIYPILAFISPREILFSLTCYDVQFQKGDICAILEEGWYLCNSVTPTLCIIDPYAAYLYCLYRVYSS